MIYYITKYALTAGIEKIETDEAPIDGLLVDRCAGFHGYYHGEGREWHKTFQGALARAVSMRAKKIVSLNKSITKLEKLQFTKP